MAERGGGEGSEGRPRQESPPPPLSYLLPGSNPGIRLGRKARAAITGRVEAQVIRACTILIRGLVRLCVRFVLRSVPSIGLEGDRRPGVQGAPGPFHLRSRSAPGRGGGAGRAENMQRDRLLRVVLDTGTRARRGDGVAVSPVSPRVGCAAHASEKKRRPERAAWCGRRNDSWKRA